MNKSEMTPWQRRQYRRENGLKTVAISLLIAPFWFLAKLSVWILER